MTAEAPVMRLVRDGFARIRFLGTLDPLPLVDPTEAARFLNVRRHTLACYRSLGDGPTYYKFGRWIRYAWTDLLRHSGRTGEDNVAPMIRQPEDASPRDELLLVDSLAAARFLTLTRFCLNNYRQVGGGPPFCRLGRRIHYPVDGLRRWAAGQRVQTHP